MTEQDSQYRFWLFWLATVLLYTVVRVNIIDIPLDRDEGVFGYIGQSILDRELPYRDVFDHKPPVVFYLNAVALLLVPPTASGIHLFLHLYNFLTLVSLFFLARIYFKSTQAGMWTALSYAIFSASPAIQGFTASTEMFMLLPITWSLLFAVLAVRRERIVFAFLSGLAGALACWTKQTAVFSVLFSVLYLVSAGMPLRGEQRNTRGVFLVKSLMAWLVGGVGVSLLIAGYFYLNGVFDEFIYWSFKHSLLYSQALDEDLGSRMYAQVKYLLRGDFVLIGVGTLAGILSLLREQKHGYFILGFLVLSVAGTLPGFAFGHYYAQLAPAVAVAAGFGFARLVETMPTLRRRWALTIFCFISMVSVPLAVHSEYYVTAGPNEISRSIFGANPFPESRRLAELISQNTDPEEKVFILGSEAQILFYAQRKSATSYVLVYPMMSTAYPRYKEFQRRAWEEVENNAPRYILIVRIPMSVLWDRKAEMFIFDKTLDVTQNHYSLEGVMMISGTRGQLLDPSEYLYYRGLGRIGNGPRIHIFRKKS